MGIVRVKLEDLPPLTKEDKERLRRLAELPDSEIDVSDIPEVDAAWFEGAEWRDYRPKKQVTVRLDADILDFFKAGGRGYQTRMNAALRAFVEAKKQAG